MAEGRRRAAVPGQRVVDVTGHDDLDAAQPRVEAGHVDRVQQAQGGAPRGRSRTSASRNRTPNARAIPVPPSVVALPPTPSTTRLTPRSSAASISSPTPYVVAVNGAGRPPGNRRSPAASAISMTAVSPDTAKLAVTGSPVGPATVVVTRS